MLKILQKLLPKEKIPPCIGTSAEMIQRDLAEHIEMYAAAFLKETNLNASECVLIASPVFFGYQYEFKKKDAPQEIAEQNGHIAQQPQECNAG